MAWGDDNEKVFDDKIAPLMTEIFDVCERHDIPFFATFTFRPGSHAASARSCPEPDIVNGHIRMETENAGWGSETEGWCEREEVT